MDKVAKEISQSLGSYGFKNIAADDEGQGL